MAELTWLGGVGKTGCRISIPIAIVFLNVTRVVIPDRDHENARRFASSDEFEELELNSTLTIDTQAWVHWIRTGGKPFADSFLLPLIKRMNQSALTEANADPQKK